MVRSYSITKEQYNYMLPIFGLATNNCKMLERNDKYYFIGDYSEYLDFLERCIYLND